MLTPRVTETEETAPSGVGGGADGVDGELSGEDGNG